jgi:hypothetical protein
MGTVQAISAIWLEQMTAHMHRPSRANCGNCDAFHPNPAAPSRAGQPAIGHCAAMPPQLMQGMAAVPGSHLSPQGPQMMPVVQGAWPPTDASKWCRAHQFREDDYDQPS